MENVLKINAGIACSDRANEVEPRPRLRLVSVDQLKQDLGSGKVRRNEKCRYNLNSSVS